ncbi:snaclec coagulation factor IX-binding protein subunit A-like [Dunckerocampus dactyliophorus]|uniref:snaclec coagulation factor IX-binding protein subunit A-like n=1 Tax=Dunckerocampus dactyliophorus TaxID=161453 RepID=UPI0024058D53|nr:snaclec coagulation factor IX-binding protein subunit A-like [Dunckerocampus dactyliophorus]
MVDVLNKSNFNVTLRSARRPDGAVGDMVIRTSTNVCFVFFLPKINNCVADNDCPKGWTQLNDHCYIFHEERKTFADAEHTCKFLGGNLVSIHSDLENEVVLELLREADEEHAWIGLHNAIKKEDYIWTDGSDVDFLNFGVGMSNDAGDGLWDGDNFLNENPFVCIREVS